MTSRVWPAAAAVAASIQVGSAMVAMGLALAHLDSERRRAL